MVSRTTGAIALETIKADMFFLSLSGWKVITRRSWTELSLSSNKYPGMGPFKNIYRVWFPSGHGYTTEESSDIVEEDPAESTIILGQDYLSALASESELESWRTLKF
jgi:hypothetical protein